MQETRNLLRNLIPAGVLYFYSGFFFVILNFEAMLNGGVWVPNFGDWPLAGIISFFALLSPAIGHLISTIHHSLYNSISLRGIYPSIDHSQFIKDYNPWIVYRLPPGKQSTSSIDPWVLINFLWHSHFDRVQSNQLIENRNNLLSHIAHGNGALFIAALLSLPVALILEATLASLLSVRPSIDWLALFLSLASWFPLLAIHRWSYSTTLEKEKEFVEINLAAALTSR
tara:strand:- start:55 stop:735 length:681 start_codon:yes stop_codon:yes gene_type:complete